MNGDSGKNTCPLTRYVHFLECPFIRDSTALVSFPFSRAWAGDQYCLLERLLYMPLSFPKRFCLSDMVDNEWNGTGEISHYFAYQNFSLGTRSHTQFHYFYKIPNTCLLIPNHLEMRSQKFENLSPPVHSNPPTLPWLSSRTSRSIRKNLYLYPLVNSCFFYFLLKLRIACQLIT